MARAILLRAPYPRLAPRQAGWTNAVPQPTWPGEIPTWDGHKNPKWQYKSGSNWVDVPAGATVSSIAATE